MEMFANNNKYSKLLQTTLKLVEDEEYQKIIAILNKIKLDFKHSINY